MNRRFSFSAWIHSLTLRKRPAAPNRPLRRNTISLGTLSGSTSGGAYSTHASGRLCMVRVHDCMGGKPHDRLAWDLQRWQSPPTPVAVRGLGSLSSNIGLIGGCLPETSERRIRAPLQNGSKSPNKQIFTELAILARNGRSVRALMMNACVPWCHRCMAHAFPLCRPQTQGRRV